MRILPLLLLVACKSAPPAPPAPTVDNDAAFWKWFGAHAAEVATIKRADEPIADQLADELHKVHPKLTFEMGIGMTPKEFIVSADGMLEAFPAVKKLVAAAPAIPGWKVIAFRPRKQMTEIQIGAERMVKISDLKFATLRPPGSKIDVAVYLLAPVDNPAKSAVFLLLDSMLGEYDVETRLGEIQMLDLKEAPKDARPLAELPALVDKK